MLCPQLDVSVTWNIHNKQVLTTHLFFFLCSCILAASFCCWASETPTWFEGFQRQSPLSSSLGTVVLHHSKAQEAHLFKVHVELKVLIPHRVEGVAVDGLGTEVAAVNRHAQDVHLDAGTSSAVTGANVLTGDDLRENQKRGGVTWWMSTNNNAMHQQHLQLRFFQHYPCSLNQACFQCFSWKPKQTWSQTTVSKVTLTCQQGLYFTPPHHHHHYHYKHRQYGSR